MYKYNHYCYQMDWGFLTCNVEIDTPPEEHFGKWGVNEAKAQLIKDGATIEVIDGELVITVEAVEGEII